MLFFRKNGKKTIGIDVRSKGFDKRALNANVKLIEMDAGKLEFEDETFDFIFSFDSFEHFLKPEKVLKESLRVP